MSVDINSARATRGSDIETTRPTPTSKPRTKSRQLRIRDIGGLIVIDFIDMESPKNQRDVEDWLRDAVRWIARASRSAGCHVLVCWRCPDKGFDPRSASRVTWSARVAPASAASAQSSP